LNELYFTKYIKGQDQTEVYWMKKENNLWSRPEKASFTQAGSRDNSPLFLGKDTLLYYSTRFGGSICRITRNAGQWSQPVRFSLSIPAGKFLGKQFSISSGGTIYAELWNNDDSDADVYCWKPVNGQYTRYEKLSDNINTTSYDFMPWIHPEEKYLLFCSQSPGGYGKTDIYVSFRHTDGTWTIAKNMGPKFNSAEEEAFPALSPDGQYLFFCREGNLGFNPYWIDRKAIEDLKSKVSH
jgi:hypothetical protein